MASFLHSDLLSPILAEISFGEIFVFIIVVGIGLISKIYNGLKKAQNSSPYDEPSPRSLSQPMPIPARKEAPSYTKKKPSPQQQHSSPPPSLNHQTPRSSSTVTYQRPIPSIAQESVSPPTPSPYTNVEEAAARHIAGSLENYSSQIDYSSIAQEQNSRQAAFINDSALSKPVQQTHNATYSAAKAPKQARKAKTIGQVQTPVTSTSSYVRRMVSNSEALKVALITREILGPPKGLN